MPSAPDPTSTAVAVLTNASVAPWWGVPVIAGSFLLIGAVLGYFFNRAQDNRKAKREHAERWYDHVRALSARAVSTTREYVDATYRIGDQEGRDPDAPNDKEFAPAAEVFSRLQGIWGELALVAPKSLEQAMRRIIDAAHEVRVAYYRDELDQEVYSRVSAAGTAFMDDVRAYLKVDDAGFRKEF